MEEIFITDHDCYFIVDGKLIPTSEMKSTTMAGDQIKINGNEYVTVDMGNNICCDGCSFLNCNYCQVFGLPCACHEREDNRNVVFKLIVERKQREFNGLFTTSDLKVKLGYRWK